MSGCFRDLLYRSRARAHERKRDRQTDRDRETEGESERDRQRHRETDRQTDRGTERETDRQTDRQRDRQTDRQREREDGGKRAARFVLNRYRNTSSVSSTLDTLGWPSLENRRQVARLSKLFKVHHGLVHCPSLKEKLVPLPDRRRRGHDRQFHLITSRTQYRAASFLPRTVKNEQFTTRNSSGQDNGHICVKGLQD